MARECGVGSGMVPIAIGIMPGIWPKLLTTGSDVMSFMLAGIASRLAYLFLYWKTFAKTLVVVRIGSEND